MRDYQLAGLNWLIRLYENGINGILADEMVCMPILRFNSRIYKAVLAPFPSIRQCAANDTALMLMSYSLRIGSG